LLLDRGLPVRDLVLALESGDPDFERVLGRPETDLERLRLLPLAGESTGSSGGGDLAGLGLGVGILVQKNSLLDNSLVEVNQAN